MRLIPVALALVCAWALAGRANAGLQFQFDYRYDSYGFFDDPVRREALEAAGRFVNRYVDNLDAIIPSGGNGWSSFFTRPDGTSTFILKDLEVPADTVQIFVAGRPLPGRLAQAIDTAPVGNGDPDWIDTVAYRGQTGAADDPATDFGPMGGTISFNNDLSEVRWHFDVSTAGLNATEFDFITVAMHELLHVLGFGISVSFSDHVNVRNEFIGTHSVAVGSPTNPSLELQAGEAHWEVGTKSTWNGAQRDALMAPGIFPGRRTFPSALDRAALRDIGWEEARPGDANRDRRFDSSDLITVFQTGVYETGNFAGWSDGDWNDNARFESSDLIAALATGTYEQPSLALIELAEAEPQERQVTFTYVSETGELFVDVENSQLTAVQMVSDDHRFIDGALVQNGPFDISRVDKLFVMDLNGFNELNFGSVLPAGLELDQVLADLSIQGAWIGGGVLEKDQWRLVPEPSAALLLACGLASMLGLTRRKLG